MADLNEEKFILAAVIGVLMIAAWALTAKFTGLQTNLSTIVGGLTGIYAIFCGGHVSQKWIEGKQNPDGSKDPAELDQDVAMTEDDQAVADKARSA